MSILKKTYEIPEINYDRFLEKIATLNKRAKKLGCSEIIVETLRYEDRKDEKTYVSKNSLTTGIIRRYYIVELTGETPKYNGWEFIGAIQHLPSDKNENLDLIKVIPGETIPEGFKNRGNVCDHCEHKRFRKDTFIVRNNDQAVKQVGRTCLKDFLGHDNPHMLAGAAELLIHADDLGCLAEDDEWGGGGGSGYRFFDLEIYLGFVVGAIKTKGWTSRTRAYEQGITSTAEWALSSLSSKLDEKDKELREILENMIPGDEEKELAKGAIEWAIDLNETETKNNDYLYNINIIAKSGVVDINMIGYAASIISAYKKNLYIKKEIKESNYFGEVGIRGNFKLAVIRIIPLEGRFGMVYLHIFQDEKGNKAIWYASNDSSLEEDSENFLDLKGRVKKHDTDQNGIKQTILTRITFLN